MTKVTLAFAMSIDGTCANVHGMLILVSETLIATAT
jgi:hypothetical protein